MIFWAGVLLGFVANMVATYCWDWIERYKAHCSACRLVGTWVAYNVHGRHVDATPMEGAGLTEVSSKPHWWSENSAVLDVRAEDTNTVTGEKRQHDGHIVFDEAIPWLANRIDRYADSNEIAQQQLVIASDLDIVYVFPIATGATLGDVYGKHAWRRKRTSG
jgi:hypothetical protein